MTVYIQNGWQNWVAKRSVDLSALLREFKGILLIPSTVKNVEDVGAVAGLAVVD